MSPLRSFIGPLLLVVGGAPLSAADDVAVFPRQFALSTPQSRQRLVLEELRNSVAVGELRDGVMWSSSDEKIVRIDQGRAVPVGDGRATISGVLGSRKATADVTVTGQKQPFAWSFRNHVEAVLSKAGCNGGACHGAQAGKNGFKLSLFGYDPAADYRAIARQDRGRRLAPADPGRSLLLTKPTQAIPHKGGLRLDVGSREYQVLAEWIAAGSPPPQENDPRLVGLEVQPRTVRLAKGAKQQLLVTARFSDGHAEDVTDWVKFTSTNESVASVDSRGTIMVQGYGEASITAWYHNQIIMATVVAPYPQAVPAEVFVNSPRHNFIDELVLAKLAALNLPPSPPCSDADFIRRVSLDALGVLPTVDETRAFVADPSPDKRQKLVDALLARPEFVDYWTYRWSDLLLVNSGKLRPPAMKAYSQWIRRHVQANTPWDALVRELVASVGSTLDQGATNFYVLHQDPADMAETVSMAFLGMSINCAKCHNHPLEKWTNDQYYGMANLFARVRLKNGPADGQFVVFSSAEGDLVQPTTGAVQPPRPLDGTPPADPQQDRRVHLAAWLTAPQNPYFTRAIVNRVWANYFGVGLVEKVDDLRLTNPASNDELLAALAKYLVDEKYNLRALMRTILLSATYQRDSRPLPGNQGDTRYYSRYYPKRLPAEVLLDAISRVTDVPTEFPNYPKGTRALELPDVNVASYFLQTFGRPERAITCDCERTNSPSMVQVLHLSNGDTLNQKLSKAGNRIDRLLTAGTPDLEIIDELYLAAVSRPPTEAERVRLLLVLGSARQGERRQVFEDFFWAVLSGKEFLFNH